jgi:acetyl-CoA synthetase
MNACYNAVDRHIDTKGNQVALLWEGDEPGDTKAYTYTQLLARVCQIANAMKAEGVKKGDVVTVYLPMMPEVTMVMLACAR